MTVANGREFLSIPGPTNVPDAVLAAMQRPAIDIYSGDMLEMTRSLHEDLSKVFRTESRVYIYAANGHGGWEAALSNVLSRGETVLVNLTGRDRPAVRPGPETRKLRRSAAGWVAEEAFDAEPCDGSFPTP